MHGCSRLERPKGKSHHADGAESEIRAQPVKGLVGRRRLQFHPAKNESQKRCSKANRDHSGRAEKPFTGQIAPHPSCHCELIRAHAHSHHDDEERDGAKGDGPGCAKKNEQSECAGSNAVQRQKPGVASLRAPDGGCGCASPRGQGQHAHESDRVSAVHKCPQNQGSIRDLHGKKDQGECGVKSSAKCQQPPAPDQGSNHGAPPDHGPAVRATEPASIIALGRDG